MIVGFVFLIIYHPVSILDVTVSLELFIGLYSSQALPLLVASSLILRFILNLFVQEMLVFIKILALLKLERIFYLSTKQYIFLAKRHHQVATKSLSSRN